MKTFNNVEVDACLFIYLKQELENFINLLKQVQCYFQINNSFYGIMFGKFQFTTVNCN